MGWESSATMLGQRDGASVEESPPGSVAPVGSDPAAAADRQYKILIVDDEPVTLKHLELAFEAQGFEVWPAESSSRALSTLQTRGMPHLVLIDYLMPGMTGLECAALLQTFSDVPVVVMSGRSDTATVLRAFEVAAEDFIAKPINFPVLMARVRRILKRHGDAAAERRLRVDEYLELELGRRRAIVDGAEVRLSNAETKLLSLMVNSAPRALRVEYIFDRIWPLAEVFDEAPLRALIYRIRRKIEPRPRKPRYLKTERGLGYRFPAISTRSTDAVAV